MALCGYRILLMANCAILAAAAGAGRRAPAPLLFLANHGQAPPPFRFYGEGTRVDGLFLSRRSAVSRGGKHPSHAIRRGRPRFPAGSHEPPHRSGEFPDWAEGPMAAGAALVWGSRISKPLSGNRHDLRGRRPKPEIRVRSGAKGGSFGHPCTVSRRR